MLSRYNSLGSYKEKELSRQTILKSSLFSVEISLILSYHTFFETTKCHFLVVQVIFVKRSDGQLAGRDKVILNISHASRVPDNRIEVVFRLLLQRNARLSVYTILHWTLWNIFSNIFLSNFLVVAASVAKRWTVTGVTFTHSTHLFVIFHWTKPFYLRNQFQEAYWLKSLLLLLFFFRLLIHTFFTFFQKNFRVL